MQHYSKQDIAEQLTPRQALQDIVYFIQEQQTALGCGPRGSPEYCPVMTVGGSYAGLLSTLIRMEYPDVVDIGYAASPCLLLYSHQVTPYVYYEYVTQVAERISPGCPNAVQETLEELQSDLVTITSRTELQTIAEDYGVCSKNLSNSHNSTIPTGSDLAHQLVAYTANQFISTNMDYYPPRPDQKFFQGCAIFQEPNKSAAERMRNYIAMITDDTDGCYEFATPSAQSDDAPDLWDALCCYLVPMIGKSNDTMWPADTYELENDIENCQTNFGITADPQYLEKEFGWNGDLMKNNDGGSSSSSVTRLILTNGYNDGWFPLSFTDPSYLGNNAKHNGVVILNMVNGAHHSDLTHQLQADTPDVALVHAEIAQLLSEWLEEIRRE
jgi:lysosomal Pro-X carboxypeptidase